MVTSIQKLGKIKDRGEGYILQVSHFDVQREQQAAISKAFRSRKNK